jgi:hypothetical protein
VKADGISWHDAFLGAAFGPMLGPIHAKCDASRAESTTTGQTVAITAQNVAGRTIDTAASGTSLPLYIIDGDYDANGGVDCSTCNLGVAAKMFCSAACDEGRAPTKVASSAGEACTHSCRTTACITASCAQHAFCNIALPNTGTGSPLPTLSVCQACSDCAPKPQTSQTYESVMLEAPDGQELRLTVQSVFLPEGTKLEIFPNKTSSHSSGGMDVICVDCRDKITLQGHALNPEKSVVVSQGGAVEVRLVGGGGAAVAGKPATFRIEVDAVCTVRFLIPI